MKLSQNQLTSVPEAKTWFRSPVQEHKERVDLSSSKVGDLTLHLRSVRAGRHCHTQLTATAEMDLDVKVWKRMFQELIREVKPWHTWQLTLDKSLLPNILKPGWAQYQQWTFAW